MAARNCTWQPDGHLPTCVSPACPRLRAGAAAGGWELTLPGSINPFTRDTSPSGCSLLPNAVQQLYKPNSILNTQQDHMDRAQNLTGFTKCECYLSKKLEDAPISKFALCPFYHTCLISCLAFPPVNVVHPGSREGSSGKAFSQQHLQAIPNQDLQQVTPPQEHLSSTGPWFL